MKKVLVDMSCTLLHHGHIRLLKSAAEIGSVTVALTVDSEVLKTKGYIPELSYEHRREILLAIRYVDEVIPCNWLIDNDFIEKNNIDVLVHGDDNSNPVTCCEVLLFPRTAGISSSLLRSASARIQDNM